MIKEIEYFPEDHEKERIESQVLGPFFPWYWQDKSTSERYPFLVHGLKTRSSQGSLLQEGEVCSDWYDFFYSIFIKCCADAGIVPTTVCRAALNSTFYDPDKVGEYHVDHTFTHKNFILYLTHSSGGTRIKLKNKARPYTVIPHKFKAVFFDSEPHAQEFCSKGERRVVLVFTFV